MKLQTVQSFVVGILLILLGGVVGYRFGSGQTIPVLSRVVSAIPQSQRLVNTKVPSSESSVDFSQFWEVWNRLESFYVDPEKLDAKKMVYGAIQGMTSALGDPYTMYLPPEEHKRSVEDLQGAFDGVGIQLGYKNQTLAVIAPLKGHSAEKAGVQAGDFILRIKDEKKNVDKETTGISLPEAVNLIRGPKGTYVKLTFLREGGKPEEKELMRDTIIVPSVELKYVEKNGKHIAHIILSRFGERTDNEWKKIVDDILTQKKKVSGAIVDVRNNPGGYLQGAIDIASEFIPNGPIVTQQGRVEKQTYTVSRRGRLTEVPVVVLANKGSASASEIVAGALRDRRGAKLVGENTFGKGTVQDAQNDLPDGAGLHITIAKWLLPSGSWIHEKGLSPDVEIVDDQNTPDIDEAVQKAAEML
ncbi:MAG: S41 family peptidase [Candidatus Pacebacteria bacterium]|nr:S41 family peptidase [Candidatus Paceibacterota bacterium]